MLWSIYPSMHFVHQEHSELTLNKLGKLCLYSETLSSSTAMLALQNWANSKASAGSLNNSDGKRENNCLNTASESTAAISPNKPQVSTVPHNLHMYICQTTNTQKQFLGLSFSLKDLLARFIFKPFFFVSPLALQSCYTNTTDMKQ